jgi:glycosyltransferase involved in cell wall biosynthesis
MPVKAKPRIAYLLKTFPRLSETFILNEILGLESLGVSIEIFSLKRPAEERAHASVAKVRARVNYIPSLLPNPLGAFRCLLAHVLLFLTRPALYLRTLRFFVTVQKSRLKDLAQAGFLARSLQRHGITHLHAHFANVPTSVGELVRCFTGIPYSFTAHAKDIYLTPDQELRRKIAGASFVLTCTGFNASHLAAISDGSTPVQLAYHGVDLDFFQARPTARSADECPVIVSVGRFCEKKGLAYLIQACALLKQQNRRFRCRIIGYGELRDQLSSLISDLGLSDCVSLEGPFTQDQVREAYSRADAFVLPCVVTDSGDRDGIPNVLLEAMSMGVPVISTGVSGIGELIRSGANGLLIQPRDAGAIAQSVALLLDAPLSARRLAETGRRTVLEHFEMRQSARAVAAAFERYRFGAEEFATREERTCVATAS